jgi:hypothetical protein
LRSSKTQAKEASSRSRTILTFSSFMLAVMMGVLPTGGPGPGASLGPRIALAQNFGQRVIQGKVVDDTGTFVGGATVFLKNLKSRDIRSFNSTADGSFRFAQVGMVDDYEVWAEKGKQKSAVKTISSFDSRKELDIDLKLK